jgi:tRNA(fMet)-specific endonuclease VapC
VNTPSIPLALLDTDKVSEILKARDPRVRQRSAAYLQQHGQFAFSAITRYEAVRGLRRKRATRQLQRFLTFCQHSLIFAVSDEVLDRAADLWVTASHAGHPRNDADLIVAASALENGRVLVTRNSAHFAWIPGLVVEDWRQP